MCVCVCGLLVRRVWRICGELQEEGLSRGDVQMGLELELYTKE